MSEGLHNSAVLLMALGAEEASEVFKFLTPKEVNQLGEYMAKLKNVSREQIDGVVEQFTTEAGAQSSIGMDTDEYLRNVLGKALGEEKAKLILDRILSGGDTSGIEKLKWIDAATVAELIKNEHPQIIATILVHLERDHAAAILDKMVPRVRADVMLRVATLDTIQPNALRELNDALSRALQGNDQLNRKSLGGVRMAAEILNLMPGAMEQEAVEAIRTHDADLAQKIQDEMFKFEDILNVDDKGMQAILREVQGDSLVLALKGADQAMRDKIFKNMSQRAAEQMKEDLETRGPVRLSEVEAQQKEILKIVRRLAEEGTLQLGAKGDDAFV